MAAHPTAIASVVARGLAQRGPLLRAPRRVVPVGFHRRPHLLPGARALSSIPVPAEGPLLTDAQVEFYHRNGFVAVEDFLPPAELERWRTVVLQAVAERGDQKFSHPGEDVTNTADREFYDAVFVQRVNLWQTSEAVKQLLFASRVGAVAAQLEGRPIRMWHDQALIKEGWANATSWHVDVPYWSFDSTHAISCWVALDASTLRNGALHFLPGSHRRLAELDDPYQEIQIGKNMQDLFKCHPLLRDIEPVAVELPAGGATFHNGLTAHGAGPNMTPHRRAAMTLQMMPADENAFNGKQNVLTLEQVEALQIGDRLDAEEQNPMLSPA